MMEMKEKKGINAGNVKRVQLFSLMNSYCSIFDKYNMSNTF